MRRPMQVVLSLDHYQRIQDKKYLGDRLHHCGCWVLTFKQREGPHANQSEMYFTVCEHMCEP